MPERGEGEFKFSIIAVFVHHISPQLIIKITNTSFKNWSLNPFECESLNVELGLSQYPSSSFFLPEGVIQTVSLSISNIEGKEEATGCPKKNGPMF